MHRTLLALVAALTIALVASRADAKVAAVYASGQGGVQNSGDNDPGLGFEVGGRILIFDGYLDYMGFGGGEAVSRGILGLRGGIGTHDFRLVLRGGAGGIREERGALTGPAFGGTRTGIVARGGAGVEGRLNPLLWLGFGFDAETYRFGEAVLGAPASGSDVLVTMKLLFELGI